MGDTRIAASDHVSFSIQKGEFCVILGPSGAGKTTVFNMLTGVYRPTDGGIRLNGENLIGKKPYEINRMGVARTFQNIRLFKELSVIDNIITEVKVVRIFKYQFLQPAVFIDNLITILFVYAQNRSRRPCDIDFEAAL